MTKSEERKGSRYQLRSAAGSFWILDMRQEGVPYRKPLAVNEVGADIWKLLEQQKGEEEIADILCRKYRADREEVRRDIVQFQRDLRGNGISI